MTDWRALEEADNRGILPDHLKGALFEAQRRGLTGPTKGAQRVQGGDLPIGERFMQGVKDIGAGAAQLAARLAPSVTPPPPPGQEAFPADVNPQVPGGLAPQVDQLVADQSADYAARRKEAGEGGGLPDFARAGGNAAAMLPGALATPAAATIPGAIAAGATGGAISGALMPVTDPNVDFWSEKGKQAFFGAALGAPTGGAAGLGAKVIAPEVAPGVKTLMKKGVTPTPGQIVGGVTGKLEEKLASVPLVGDAVASGRRRAIEQFNVAAFNDVLAPIGKASTGKIGREGIDEVEKIVGDEYERILPNVTFRADQDLVDQVVSLRQLASFMPDEQFKQFEKVLQQKIGPRLGEQGTMDGRTFQNLDSELGKIAKGYRSGPDPDKRELGDAIYELQSALRATLERNNPMHAEQLGKAREAYKRFIRVQRAATYTGGEPGVFSPDQFLSAVKASDSSVRKGAVARGDAVMQALADAGKSVLGSKVPDSGTAGRLMAAMLTGGAIEPNTLMASLPLTLPYTGMGQKAMAALLTKRPPGSDLAADLLRAGIVPAGAAAGGSLVQQ